MLTKQRHKTHNAYARQVYFHYHNRRMVSSFNFHRHNLCLCRAVHVVTVCFHHIGDAASQIALPVPLFQEGWFPLVFFSAFDPPSFCKSNAWHLRRTGEQKDLIDNDVIIFVYIFYENVQMQLVSLCCQDNMSCLVQVGIRKRKCHHFDYIFITGCTGNYHFYNFQCSQWLRLYQNEDISVSVAS